MRFLFICPEPSTATASALTRRFSRQPLGRVSDHPATKFCILYPPISSEQTIISQLSELMQLRQVSYIFMM
jgi:hypothetical protein